MGVNPDLARIFGGDDDAIHLAPISADLPTTIDGEPGVGFEDVGWLHSDGVKEAQSGQKKAIRGHQGGKVVRTRMTEPGTTIEFIALESKAQTRELRYDVKQTTTLSGVRREKRSPGQKVSVRKAVVDFFDADDDTIRERWLIDRLEITPNGERVYGGSDIAGYPFIGEIIGDYEVLSYGPDSADDEDTPPESEG